MKKIIPIILLALLSSSLTFSFDLESAKKKVGKVVDVPIKNLSAVSIDGDIHLISGDGRFVIKGMIYDVWYEKNIDTIDQLETASTRIFFDQMKINKGSLNHIMIGDGEKEVTVFVDPLCGICNSLIPEIEKLTDQYTFKLVMIPALGKKSDVLARKFYCAKDDSSKKLTALKEKKLNDLEQVKDCDYRDYDLTLLLSHLIGIKGVPFIVAPDGRFITGKPKNIAAWLEGDSL